MSAYRGIDWHAQWALHAPNFCDGAVPVDVGRQKPLYLVPGPGFGDLSHPTTRMMIKLIKSHPLHAAFVDIGSGSGVLSLAAAALGAPQVYGIEIDPEAIEHARKNAAHNGLKAQFCLPHQFKLPAKKQSITLAMNMIRSEQAQAWASLPALHGFEGDCFTSGILEEEREAYLKEAAARGWEYVTEINDNGWLAFYFLSC